MTQVKRVIGVVRLGVVEYGAALQMQTKLATQRKQGLIQDTLLVLSHFPVYTVGKRRTWHNILIDEEKRKKLGVDVFEIDRGGDVTCHDPGQIVMYPIVSLREARIGARAFVEGLEDVMIDTCKEYGVDAYGRMAKETGVWVKGKKIGAVGVQISSGVSMHGLAFNSNTDMKYFRHIIACGLPGKEVTSLHKQCEGVDYQQVQDTLVRNFVKVFDYEHGSEPVLHSRR